VRVADCQGFAGGFTVGAVQAGLELVTKCENVGGFGVRQCEANRRVLGDNWEAQVGTPDTWQPVSAEVVIANPPCSGFSVMSKPSFRGVDSRINSCMWDAVRYAASCNPDVYVMESVRAAFTKGLPLMRQLRAELEEITGHQYALYHVLQDNYALGGVSRRPRYFMVCSRVPFGVEAPTPRYQPVLADAIGDLVDLPLSWEAQPYNDVATWWSAPLRNDVKGADTPLWVDGHALPKQAQGNLLFDLMDGCTPRHWVEGLGEGLASKRFYETHGTLPPSWHAKVKKQSGKTLAQWSIDREFVFGMFQTGRWYWNRHARVVTGAGPFIGIHPVHDRFFTHREIARVMGFPDSWLIDPLRDEKTLVPGWGKGVSVHPGQWVASWAKASIEGRPGTEQTGRLVDSFMPGVANEDREWFIDVSKVWKKAPASPLAGDAIDPLEVEAAA
jgi:site-specific DNA-cytosine methylase